MTRVTSFVEFWESWQPFRGGKWVFRGVSDANFKLIPKVGRHQQWSKSEHRMLDQFVREAATTDEGSAGDVWEQLAVAQHHGLPTRLLDWSENPLVAAYFACCEKYEQDGAIYIASIHRRIDPAKEAPFSIEHVARYRPRHISKRIQAQRGLFSVHPNPTEALDLALGSSDRIHKIIVDSRSKEQMIWDLSRVNINSASLFPDLAGLAANITWAFSAYDPAKAAR